MAKACGREQKNSTALSRVETCVIARSAPDLNRGRRTVTRRNLLNDLSRRSMIGDEAPSSRVVVSTPSASVLVTLRFSGGVSSS